MQGKTCDIYVPLGVLGLMSVIFWYVEPWENIIVASRSSSLVNTDSNCLYSQGSHRSLKSLKMKNDMKVFKNIFTSP